MTRAIELSEWRWSRATNLTNLGGGKAETAHISDDSSDDPDHPMHAGSINTLVHLQQIKFGFISLNTISIPIFAIPNPLRQ